MDLLLADKTILVGGASSGLGRGVAEVLLKEGARVVAVARNPSPLAAVQADYPRHLLLHAGDLTKPATIEALLETYGPDLSGALINAGGPPAGAAVDLSLDDWDAAYRSVLRWKVQLINGMIPYLQKRSFGRILLVESMSVKQPVANLVLSNSFRLAVVGYVKTLASEIASSGITLNMLAPGFHDTPRIQQLMVANHHRSGRPLAELRQAMYDQIPTGQLGTTEDFGALAAWLFSPHSRYLTGQTISVDGGVVKGTFG